jgi:hypothetical protein
MPSPCSNGSRPSWNAIPGQLLRAAIELAKDWRTDRYLRKLEALMAVADKDVSLLLTGTGDVLEPEGRHHCDRLGRQLRALRGAGADRRGGASMPRRSPASR